MKHPYRKQAAAVQAIPRLPPGSRIRMSQAPGRLSFRWRPALPESDNTRTKLVFICLGLLLCYSARPSVKSSLLFQFGAYLLLVFGVACWTLAGAHTYAVVAQRLKGPGPERLTLTESELWLEPSLSGDGDLLMRLLRPVKVRVRKSDLSSLRLENIGARQRLLFDHGTDQVEIGKHLWHADREWLADVIRRWQTES